MSKVKRKTQKKSHSSKSKRTQTQPLNARHQAPEQTRDPDREGGPVDERLQTETKSDEVYTPGELGQPGPLDQEGEGNRQNDELAELEQINPEKEEK